MRMTANEMTNRDAAQIAALPKSAVWSQLLSHGLLGGRAGRSLTSERLEHTSSPATSGGHPKRLPLERAERACEEVRLITMNRHTTHEPAAGVALTGGSGGGRAVWQVELSSGVASPWPVAGSCAAAGDLPPVHGLAGHAGRAVLATACPRSPERRGGLPSGVHPFRPGEQRLERRGGLPNGVHPIQPHDERLERRGGHPRNVHPIQPPAHERLERRGGYPDGVHPFQPHTHRPERWGGLPNGVHPIWPNEHERLEPRGGHPRNVHPIQPQTTERLERRGGRPRGAHPCPAPRPHRLKRRGGLLYGSPPHAGLYSHTGPDRRGGHLLRSSTLPPGRPRLTF
jgi:hypothetical protein